MKSTEQVPLALILIAVLSACGGSDKRTPSAPSAPSSPSAPAPPGPPPSAPGSGTIAIRELSPAPGAMLGVRSDCPAGPLTQMCTDQWRGTFDVMVDREMTNAVLNVRFYDGETICGHGSTGFDILPADTRVSFTVQKIVFSDEFGTFKQPCQLPATTNRIEAVLWSDHGNWTNVLIQVFEAGYTFSESPRSPAVDLTGSYALTFEVGSGCEQVPKELRTRSYEASIEYWKSVESRDLFFAELSGSTFHHYHRG